MVASLQTIRSYSRASTLLLPENEQILLRAMILLLGHLPLQETELFAAVLDGTDEIASRNLSVNGESEEFLVIQLIGELDKLLHL